MQKIWATKLFGQSDYDVTDPTSESDLNNAFLLNSSKDSSDSKGDDGTDGNCGNKETWFKKRNFVAVLEMQCGSLP